jgi:hypothetical protein
VVVSWLPASLIHDSWDFVLRNRAQHTVSKKVQSASHEFLAVNAPLSKNKH